MARDPRIPEIIGLPEATGRYEAKGDLYMWKPRGGLL